MTQAEQSDNADIWKEDLLGRKEEGHHLQRFIENAFKLEHGSKAPSSFVLNINSGWGQGKTWFLTRMVAQLGQNHAVVYFDAWKNDFTKDALLSFVSIICDELSKKFKKQKTITNKIEVVKSVFSTVSKSALPIVAAVLAKQLLGQKLEELELDGIQADVITDAASELAHVVSESAIDAFVTQKNAIDDFSAAIASLVNEIGKRKDLHLPICIMIDELDRCRPTYAIELLESVKHLFAIKGIFFIIATDTKQLAHSIKAVYGNDFDSVSYLKRFFYAEFNLSRPNGLSLSCALFQGESFVSQLFMAQSIRSEYGFEKMFTYICDLFGLNVRDREQVFSVLKTFVFSSGRVVDFIFILMLICFKKVDFNGYESCVHSMRLSLLLEHLKLTQNVRKPCVLNLDYQRLEGRMFRYQLEKQKCNLMDIITFYVSLLNRPAVSEILESFHDESHYIHQAQVCTYLNSISHVSNDLESYFLLIDQAGRVSINQ